MVSLEQFRKSELADKVGWCAYVCVSVCAWVCACRRILCHGVAC
jgi:hypothetical protein